MAPRPQDMSMNQQQRENSTSSGMSEAEYLAVAAAAKPKDESLYESLLRYQEEHDPGDSMSSIRKVSYDEDDDRKLPAKPTPIRNRSSTDIDNARRNNRGDESLAWEQDDSFSEPSLYPKWSAPTSWDERFDPFTGKLSHSGAATSLDTHSAPLKQSSFYKSALEASQKERHSSLLAVELLEDEKLARELARELDEKLAAQEEAKMIEEEDSKLARELDEKLAQEVVRKLEMEDAVVPACAAEDADPSQVEILRAIREDRERKELEKALQVSGGTSPGNGSDSDFYTAPDAPRTTSPHQADYLLSQQLALQEWQKAPRAKTPPNRSTNPPVLERQSHGPPALRRHHSTGNPRRTLRVSFDHYTPHSSDEAEHRSHPEEDDLLQNGNRETREAIAEGRAHVVQCLGCLGRLHAPMSYDLVYCPKCHTVSPGQAYVARDDRANIRRERSRHA